uniref:Uncharacterized protein n=1 Tax=Magallana gigas TaxID=29159 RepID=K1PJD3_MAGGI
MTSPSAKSEEVHPTTSVSSNPSETDNVEFDGKTLTILVIISLILSSGMYMPPAGEGVIREDCPPNMIADGRSLDSLPRCRGNEKERSSAKQRPEQLVENNEENKSSCG